VVPLSRPGVLPARLVRVVRSRWWVVGGLAVTAVVSVWSLRHVPHASWLPALVGLLPWVLGKYVLCPLRWSAISQSGRSTWWHLRVYAESELLGLLSPAHAGADLWRVHSLHRVGLRRTPAVAEVALDRLLGSAGMVAFVLVAGVEMPIRVVVAAAVLAAAVVLGAVVLGRRRPDLLAERPVPPLRVLARGVLISATYQATVVVLLLCTVSAMHASVDPMSLLGVFGASQVVGVLPGVNGASPREGALVVGLASIGVPWQAAMGAVALVAVLAWLPALALGGSSLALRRLGAWRGARAAA
jgi:hypothetical protein